MPKKAKPEATRFWEKVEKTDTCWNWTAAKASKYGHGKFMVKDPETGRWANRKAHRWAYENIVGPIPEGLTIDHLCRNPRCVNPAHLEPVTLAENIRRQGAAVTHCPQGHPLSGENLYVVKQTGYRQCVTCKRHHARMSKLRRMKSTGVNTPPPSAGGSES